MGYRFFTQTERELIQETLDKHAGKTRLPAGVVEDLADTLNRTVASVRAYIHRLNHKDKKQATELTQLTLAEQLDRGDKLIQQGVKLIQQGRDIHRRVIREVAELEGWMAGTLKFKKRLQHAEIDPKTGMVTGLTFEEE